MNNLLEKIRFLLNRCLARVSRPFSEAGFTFSCLWDWRLMRQPVAVGTAWFLSAMFVSYLSSRSPDSAYAQYVMQGSDETLSPILWNIIATAGLMSLGAALLLPASNFVLQWSRHVLLSAFYMGCLMLGTLTFRYLELWLNPVIYQSFYFCLLTTITGIFLLSCYAINFSLLYLATLIHLESGIIGPLKRLAIYNRGILAISLFSVIYFGVLATEVKKKNQYECGCVTESKNASE